MSESAAVDEQVVALRSAGRSYPAIAEALGMARASDALVAFQQAIRQRAPREQTQLRQQELGRLDRLARQLETRTDLDTAQLIEKLQAVDRMRDMVLDL